MTFSKLGTDTGQLVYLPKPARLQGLYLIGIQGTGKSGLIENLIMQDIDQQIGVCVLDPHGELIDHVIARLPDKTAEDKVIYLDITDYHYPFGLNLFACSDLTNPLKVQRTVDQVMHIFEKLYDVSRSTPRIAQYLRNCTHTLVANPGYTMADIPLLLTDENCRRVLVANVTDPQVRLFWKRYEQMKPSEQSDHADSILNKLEELLQPLPRNIVGQANTTIDLLDIMNDGKILLVKLDSLRLSAITSLLGAIIIALFLNAAPLRPTYNRKQFHLYADEFQQFATEDFVTLFEQARKFGIATTIAHQNRGQLNSANSKLETDLKDRSRSVANLVVFKINSKDADDLAGEFDTSPPPPAPEEKTRRAVQTPVSEPIQYMLHRGVHPHQAVRQFMETYGKALVHGAEKEEELQRENRHEWDRYIHDSATYRRTVMPSLSVSSDFRATLDALNHLFHQAMMAGKEGKDTAAIPISESIADWLIRAMSLTEPKRYLELLKAYHYYTYHQGLQVTDLSARKNELQNNLAALSHYVQDRVTSLRLELNAAMMRLRPLIKSCLIEEAAQARARMLIVWHGQYRKYFNVKLYDFNSQNPLPTFGVINQPLYASEINKQKSSRTNRYSSKGTQAFTTWEEAVQHYLDGYHTYWFRMNDRFLLDRNNWTHTTRLVKWEEWHENYKSRNTNTYWDIYDLYLDTWEPGQGIEQTWYTQVLLEAEIDRRISTQTCTDYRSTLAAFIHFSPIYKNMSHEAYQTQLIEQRAAGAVSIATTEMQGKKQKIEDELDKLKEIAAAKLSYDAFVAQFTTEVRELMRIFAVQRVEEDSGQQEIVMGHGIQLSSAEMEARISTQLVTLSTSRFEKFARVKIGETIPQNPGKKCLSCGLLNNPGVLVCGQCGTKIIGANEYLIKTLKPPDGIGTQQLEQRIKAIQANNIQQGYLQDKTKVEAEITKRQASFSGSAPAQAQVPPQQPPHARQVPTCPNCGKSNSPGSMFCNLCGAKLT